MSSLFTQNFETGVPGPPTVASSTTPVAAGAVGYSLVQTPTIDGSYCAELNRSASVANFQLNFTASPAVYYRFYFQYASNPGEGGICNFQDTTGSVFLGALHLSGTTLLMFDSTSAILGTSTTQWRPT